MLMFESLALPATAAVLVVGLVLVFIWAARQPDDARAANNKPHNPGGKRPRGTMMQMPCNRCGHGLEINTSKLVRLSGIERALTIRSHPALAQREMAEFTCPQCDTTHCLVREGQGWSWAGSNLYVPHSSAAHCAECGGAIQHIEAAPGDGAAFPDARALDPQAGTRCARCDGLICMACLLRRTHGYVPGASVICPRCGRAAVGPALPLH